MLNAAPTVLGWGRQEPPSPHPRRVTGQPASSLWGGLRCSQGSWLRLAACGPKAISHSRGPLPLCPFSPLPPIRRASEAQEQPVTCELQGEAVPSSKQDQRRTLGTKHVSFLDEVQEAGKAHREDAVQKLQTAKAAPPQISLRPATPFRSDSRRSSTRAESTEPQGRPSRLPLTCDSVKLLRQRARKIRTVQDALGQMAASPLRGESRLPEESSITRPGLLPPIKEETGSPECQPPKTKPPVRRKATPYPR